MGADFPGWSRAVIRTAATELEAGIPGAQRGKESRLRGQLALYVHFTDARLPQTLAIWLYGAEEGSAYNVPGYGNAIGVGLKYDAGEELDRGAWKLRPISPFTWRVHVDARFQGYRWLRPESELPTDPNDAGTEIAERVLMTLRRAAAVAGRTHDAAGG
jgi:hypothetical protein